MTGMVGQCVISSLMDEFVNSRWGFGGTVVQILVSDL